MTSSTPPRLPAATDRTDAPSPERDGVFRPPESAHAGSALDAADEIVPPWIRDELDRRRAATADEANAPARERLARLRAMLRRDRSAE